MYYSFYMRGIDLLLLLLSIATLICVIILLVKLLQLESGKKTPAKASVRKDPRSLKKINEIAELHKIGALTDEEYAKKKAELLSKM